MRTFSMIKLCDRGSWKIWSFLYIGFIGLILCVPAPAKAAELKDIRVGEYKGFTRIVFELDQRAIKPGIKIQSSNQLLVTFNKTIANLVRQIPVERSPHVNEIQFWQRKTTLSTVLIFDYPHIRVESFRLSRPPRFAVDVFPLAQPAKEKKIGPAPKAKKAQTGVKDQASEGVSKQSPLKNDITGETAAEQKIPTSESLAKGEPTEPSEASEASISLPESSPLLNEGSGNASVPRQAAPPSDTLDKRNPSEMTKEKVSPQGTTNQIAKVQSATPQQTGPSPMLSASNDSKSKMHVEPVQSAVRPSPPSEPTIDIKAGSDETAPPPSPNNRLQFYLVVILVIITIAILLLLLLMLLTRHQLFYDKEEFGETEISEHKDKNIIAKLDSDIKKQLKRYDET